MITSEDNQRKYKFWKEKLVEAFMQGDGPGFECALKEIRAMLDARCKDERAPLEEVKVKRSPGRPPNRILYGGMINGHYQAIVRRTV